MNFELTGKIHSIGETKTFGESFTKREFVLFIPNEFNADYPDYRKIVFTKDKCTLLDDLNINDEVRVNINLKGRLWINKENQEVCFNEDEAWKIEKLSGTMQQSAPPNNEPLVDDENNLPF